MYNNYKQYLLIVEYTFIVLEVVSTSGDVVTVIELQGIYTYIHTYICPYIHTYTHTHIRTYVHTYIYTYIHTYIHAHRYRPYCFSW